MEPFENKLGYVYIYH